MRKEAVLKQLRETRRSSWKSTEVGVRAHGVARATAHEALQAPEVEVEECVLEAVEGLPLGEFPSPGEEQARGVSQGSRVERTGVRQCPRPRSGCRTLRANGECC